MLDHSTAQLLRPDAIGWGESISRPRGAWWAKKPGWVADEIRRALIRRPDSYFLPRGSTLVRFSGPEQRARWRRDAQRLGIPEE